MKNDIEETEQKMKMYKELAAKLKELNISYEQYEDGILEMMGEIPEKKEG